MNLGAANWMDNSVETEWRGSGVSRQMISQAGYTYSAAGRRMAGLMSRKLAMEQALAEVPLALEPGEAK